MKLIHIVDSLPFDIGGVSDYAYKLSYGLKDKYNIDTFFITVKKFDHYDKTHFDKIYNIYNQNNLYEIVSHIIDQYFEKEEQVKIVLEYVGYGYQKRGCPIWLLSELKKLKSRYSIQLTTMFHELYAVSNNFMTSTFWLSWLQKYIAKQIYLLSDHVFTNTLKYRNELVKWETRQIDVLPVFSNIGEVDKVENFQKRQDFVVIFGSINTRQKVYEESEKLEHWIQALGVKKIIDIGPGSPLITIKNCEVEIKGRLESKEIQRIMRMVKFGFVTYGDGALEKSGVFASYIAHGVCSVVLEAYNGESLYIQNIDYLSDYSDLSANFEDITISAKYKYDEFASVNIHIQKYLKAIEQ